jgi:hypothetical protein
MFLKFASEYAATPVARARVATAQAERQQREELEVFTAAEPVEISDAVELDVDEADFEAVDEVDD